MNRDALADWIASLDPEERSMLAATIRAGVGHQQTIRRRNGTTYDPTAPNAVLDEITRPRGDRQRPHSGRFGGEWLTIQDVAGTRRMRGLETPAARTLRRWAGCGRIRSRKAGRDWQINVDDLERELRKATP